MHDFLVPQPEIGALVYYIRRSLLNWPYETCVQVLQQTARAMKPYSRFVVGEQVFPGRLSYDAPATGHARGMTRQGTIYDPVEDGMESIMLGHLDLMMSCVGGKSRTVGDWKALFERSGMKIVQICWEKSGTGSAYIEAASKV